MIAKYYIHDAHTCNYDMYRLHKSRIWDSVMQAAYTYSHLKRAF